MISDTALRGILFTVVIALSSLLFALALLPPIGAAARAVQEVVNRFNEIGSEVDLDFPRIPERSTIHAADGTVLATLYLEENRKYVSLRGVNGMAKKAVLAIEDSRFYEHPGLDVTGILRAVVANVRAGDIRQGASTITQQLARNVFPQVGRERTLARKIEEARVAMRLEEEYSKARILELYLNDVYFGRGVYGIGTAAEFYFGKSARDLTLREAALLAGLISAPETYSPVNDPGAAKERRNIVIGRMHELGMVSDREAARASDKGLGIDITDVGNERARFPFFVEYIKHLILHDPRFFDTFGDTYRQRKRALFQGGLEIHTTLEPDLQEAGERIVRQHLPHARDPESALASVDVRTGAIRALVSSTRFKQSQVNLATGQGGSGRQAGSAFKPFTLAAAMEENVPVGRVYNGASGQIVDCGIYGGRYRVVNAEGGSPGSVNLLTATAESINAVFVQLAADVGPPDIVEVAHRMGIQSPLDPVCSLTLGTEEVTPLEMASAFSTLANEGVRCEPLAITGVVTRNGKQLFSQRRGKCEQAIAARVANKVAGMLRLVVTDGTGTAANLGTWPVFGKTGTTNDSADLWFDGCTRQVCTATWVGHEQGRVPIPGQYGGTLAAPIWHDFMLVAMRGLPAESLPPVPQPKRARVPDVVGQPRGAALRALADANFTASVRIVPSAQPVGIVVSQSPAGGSLAVAGTRVALAVSNGRPPTVEVPQLVGLSQEEATAVLSQRGLGARVAYHPTFRRALDGTVAAQNPGPGATVEPGTRIGISVYRFQPPPEPPPEEDAGGEPGEEEPGGGGGPGGGGPGNGNGGNGGNNGGGNGGGGGGGDGGD